MKSTKFLFLLVVLSNVFILLVCGKWFQCTKIGNNFIFIYNGSEYTSVDLVDFFNTRTYSHYEKDSLIAYVGTHTDPKVISLKINRMEFRDCGLPHLPHIFFQKLGQIDEIVLNRCSIETIDSSEFPNGSVLQKLTIIHNKLKRIPGEFI